jgi:hypothetical protein
MVLAVRASVLVFVVGLVLGGCRGSGTKPIDLPPPPPPPTCGDSNIDENETCDLSNLGGATCQSLGFDTGQLVCDSTCHLSTTLCVKRCGNGTLDVGEACDGDAGLMPCAQFGYLACTDACTVDTRHCVGTAFEAGPFLDLVKGGPAVVGDLSPEGPGDLVMAVPSFSRVEAFPWVTPQGFDGVGGRKLSFLRSPVLAATCDADGDGHEDVATINQDGTFDHALYTGSSFALHLVDAGCPGSHFAGAGVFAPDGGRLAVAAGCDALWILSVDSAQRVPTPAALATTVADVDGDGRAELLWVSDAGPRLEVLAAPGFSGDGGVLLPVSPTAIAAGDLDFDGDADLAAVVGGDVQLLENTGLGYAPQTTFTGPGAADVRIVDVDLDGRLDVLWTQGTDLVIRRNRGSWLFSEVRAPIGPAPRLSFDLGDVDGDGDPDLVSTVSTGGDATRSQVSLNRVR